MYLSLTENIYDNNRRPRMHYFFIKHALANQKVMYQKSWQLATHRSRITPPGKPSTWFPGERLVTQARLFPSLLLLLFALVLRSCSLILLFDFVFVMILCYGPCSLILSAVLLFNVTFVFTSCFC